MPQWDRTGLVFARNRTGDGSEVIGDPCVVWDPEIDSWRMVMFFDPPGHADSVSDDPTGAPGSWTAPRPLRFANPEALPANGGTHKPFVVMDAAHPNRAAFVDGRYWLLTVSFTGRSRAKRVQRAWATSLAGPWTLETGDFIPRGKPGSADENHVDAISGFWFEDRQEFVYYYMGYPLRPQPWRNSPYGDSLCVATQQLGESVVKRGVMIAPSPVAGHWTSGYLGGLQLIPGRQHRWLAVLNGSPTPPDRLGNMTSEEPPPSLGGLAYTDAELPIEGWVISDGPFERIDEIPQDAFAAGEGVNFWRHHALIAGDTVRLFYNSGRYGTEQLFSKEMTRRQPDPASAG